MISWIQKYFQQHFKAVFGVLLVLTIVSFIFTIGASPGIGHGERRVIERPFFGLNLAKQDDQQKLMGDASVSAYLLAGYNGADNEQIQQYALQRYAALSIADSLRIPVPTEAELRDYIKTLKPFQDAKGEFDAEAYNRFLTSIKGKSNISEGRVSRVIADDWRADRIQKILAGPGYVMSGDIRRQLEQADTQWSLNVATVSYDSYKPSITPTEAELTKFFENNSFKYELAPQFSGSMVLVTLASELPKVKLSEEEIKAYFEANKSRFTAGAKDEASASYATLKPQVEIVLRSERARRRALSIASDISYRLFDKKATPETIAKMVADEGYSLSPLKPFTQAEPAAELNGSTEAAAEAFKLGTDRFFSDAISIPTGAVILVWKETIPSRKPALAEVRDKVLADFVENQRRERFVELGRTIKTAIEGRLKTGDTFANAAQYAATLSGVKIETKAIPPFTLRQPAKELTYTIYGTLENLQKGQLSDMTLSENAGLIVHAAEKKIPDFSENNPLVTEARAQLAKSAGTTSGNAILGEMVERELQKGEIAH